MFGFAVKPLKIVGQFSKLKIQSSLYYEARHPLFMCSLTKVSKNNSQNYCQTHGPNK